MSFLTGIYPYKCQVGFILKISVRFFHCKHISGLQGSYKAVCVAGIGVQDIYGVGVDIFPYQ